MNEIGDEDFALRNVMWSANGMPNVTVKSAFRVPQENLCGKNEIG